MPALTQKLQQTLLNTLSGKNKQYNFSTFRRLHDAIIKGRITMRVQELQLIYIVEVVTQIL